MQMVSGKCGFKVVFYSQHHFVISLAVLLFFALAFPSIGGFFKEVVDRKIVPLLDERTREKRQS